MNIHRTAPSELDIAKQFGWEDDYYNDSISAWQRQKPIIWSLINNPFSSTKSLVTIGRKIII
jgi:potassium voltage-gated channel Shaw-related subfamily C protein